MSVSSEDMESETETETESEEELLGEGQQRIEIPGEEFFGEKHTEEEVPEVEPEPKELTAEEAGKCLTLLGKIDDSMDYAFLQLSAVDMKLTSIGVIPDFQHLRFIDVSGNFLYTEDLYCLSRMKYLLMLIADRNRIDSPHLPTMGFLQVLSLKNNRITSTEDIQQALLECLELNYNKLMTLEGLKPALLPNLKTLELRGNKLTTTFGIPLSSLQALYLAENQIEELVGLDQLENLRILHLRDNKLKTLDGFVEDLRNLTYLNVRNNKMEDLKEVSKLRVLPSLQVLVVSDNPFCSDQEFDFRKPIIKELPHLRRLNKMSVTDEDVDIAFGRKLAPMEDDSEDEDDDD